VGLKWTSLDLDEGVFEVEEQIVQVGWETEVTEPKSDSDGTVALDSLTVAVLKVHHQQQQRERRDWGEAWVDSGYVFTTEQGEALHPDYVSRHFVRLVRRANELRLGSQGRAVTDVQEALGVTPSGVYGKETKQAVTGVPAVAGAGPNRRGGPAHLVPALSRCAAAVLPASRLATADTAPRPAAWRGDAGARRRHRPEGDLGDAQTIDHQDHSRYVHDSAV